METFKCSNKESPQYLQQSRLPVWLNSFRYYAAKTWNELPDHFRFNCSLELVL